MTAISSRILQNLLRRRSRWFLSREHRGSRVCLKGMALPDLYREHRGLPERQQRRQDREHHSAMRWMMR